MRYRFREQFYDIDNVKLEFYDKRGDIYELFMEYDTSKGEWLCEYEGDIDRYKFVVNDIIRLNDPMAPSYTYDSDWEVWSSSSKSASAQSKPHIAFCVTAERIANGLNKAVRKTEYVYDKPLDIYTGVSLEAVEGIHSITYICFQPDGSIYMIEEDSIGQFEPEKSDYEIIFKNHISGMPGRGAEGMWVIQIYLDGRCIAKDYFVMKRKVISNTVFFDYKI